MKIPMSLSIFDPTGLNLLYKMPLWHVACALLIILGVCRIITGIFYAWQAPKTLRLLMLPFAGLGIIATELWAVVLQFLLVIEMTALDAPPAAIVGTMFWCFISVGVFFIGAGMCSLSFHSSHLIHPHRE